MKHIKLEPSNLKGQVKIPPSKSLCHRAIICASLCEGESRIQDFVMSEDMEATIGGMRVLGAKIDQLLDQNGTLELKISGRDKKNGEYIDCIESGSTIRFLIPLALLDEGKITFDGRGKLATRPLGPYKEMFDKQNINYLYEDNHLPLTVDGVLKSGEYPLKGNISSQFITGLMFALPLLDGDSRIVITTELESKGYVDLTLDMLKKYGIQVENKDYREFIVKGNQRYSKRDYRVEGDFSQAAFWIVAGIIGNGLECNNLNLESLQGDKVILDIVREMGGCFKENEDSVTVYKSDTKGTVIDASQCPDLVPILTVLASLSKGTTRIINAARVRIKESDRLKAISEELRKLGADIEELKEGLVINGVERLWGGEVDSWNDHRIAMALAVASTRCESPVIIRNSEAVNKSYPGFWKDFESLGGNIHEWNLG
ncbi:3-phosphoshikimate 1-carboxyvinyltransferase [Proteocatella sphenisci]|uniref:3-phosphoshikimate 1-carboxyvinyltransferase n=1 Tax=Proteocatella sphenisci TaxID=181070 RepID=UPI00048E7D53|nr:3-phosphoshikimate 1-carboxyvinyltransferase [Proteocatella sphenisci]